MLSIGLTLLSTLVFLSIGAVLSKLFFNVGLQNITAEDYADQNTVNAFKLFQVLSAFGSFVLPPLLIGFLLTENMNVFLSFDKKPKWISIIVVFFISLVSTPLLNELILFNQKLDVPHWMDAIENWMKQSEENAKQLTEAFLKMNSAGDLMINLVMIGVIPAVGEELIFRGLIQKQLTKFSGKTHLSIFITAILFSAIHMQFFGFLPRMVLGVFLGYLFLWSGSIWLPMIAHFINNASAVLVAYVYPGMDQDKIGTTDESFLIVMSSVVLTSGLLYFLCRHEKNYSHTTN